MNDRQRITSITTWIAGVAAVVVTILLPLGYFAVSYQYLTGSLEAEAEMTSHIITELINANPEQWHYEQLRLEELLARRVRDAHKESRRILDLRNRVIAESRAVLETPLITRGFSLMDSGVTIGTLEISVSLFPVPAPAPHCPGGAYWVFRRAADIFYPARPAAARRGAGREIPTGGEQVAGGEKPGTRNRLR
jgi:hypothetical protein